MYFEKGIFFSVRKSFFIADASSDQSSTWFKFTSVCNFLKTDYSLTSPNLNGRCCHQKRFRRFEGQQLKTTMISTIYIIF